MRNNTLLSKPKTTNLKENFMTKKLLSILLIMAIVSVSAFAYSSYDSRKKIGIITFQGPRDNNNVTLSNLFAIKLSGTGDFIVRSCKAADTSRPNSENSDHHGSIYSSTYEYNSIKIGENADVDYVLLGQVNKLGQKTKLIIRVIDLNGNHIAGAETTFEQYEDLNDLVNSMCIKIAYEIEANSNY